jgi:site-specific DNA recombinase
VRTSECLTPKPPPIKVALYARVSTEDQAERETIRNQIIVANAICPAMGLEIVESYLDDGVSGMVPLEQRPEGARLLQDASAGKFPQVVVYRLDRIGRKAMVILSAFETLKEKGVALRSLTEPFDTSQPFGEFVMGILAMVAGYERDSMLMRTSEGRLRQARDGRWTGGVLPYGYVLDDERRLTPDWTPRLGSKHSEAEIAQRVFRTIADGEATAAALAQQFNAEGIPMARKYQPKGQDVYYKPTKAGYVWGPTNVSHMVRSRTYKGIHVWGRKGEIIEREVPHLVDEETWKKANSQIDRNRSMSKRPSDHLYLLRGIVRCANCNSSYIGTRLASGTWSNFYYRCGSQAGSMRIVRPRCDAKQLAANHIEDLVWKDIQGFVENPGVVLDLLRDRIRSEVDSLPAEEARKNELLQAIAGKEREKDRVIDAYRLGSIELEELDTYVQRTRSELETLKTELEQVMSRQAEAGVKVGRLDGADSLLRELHDRMQEPMSPETKQRIIAALVTGISVETIGSGRRKEATLNVAYAFHAHFQASERVTLNP